MAMTMEDKIVDCLSSFYRDDRGYSRLVIESPKTGVVMDVGVSGIWLSKMIIDRINFLEKECDQSKKPIHWVEWPINLLKELKFYWDKEQKNG